MSIVGLVDDFYSGASRTILSKQLAAKRLLNDTAEPVRKLYCDDACAPILVYTPIGKLPPRTAWWMRHNRERATVPSGVLQHSPTLYTVHLPVWTVSPHKESRNPPAPAQLANAADKVFGKPWRRQLTLTVAKVD